MSVEVYDLARKVAWMQIRVVLTSKFSDRLTLKAVECGEEPLERLCRVFSRNKAQQVL